MVWFCNRIQSNRFSSLTFDINMKQGVNDILSAKRFLVENRIWQSEIGSWEIDLLFCERMLDIYGLKAETAGMLETKSTLTESIQDFISVRIHNLKSQIKRNEAILNRLEEDELLFKDRQVSFRQNDDKSDMNKARTAVHGLQKRLYGFIKELKSL